jgi:purine-cytosine permease-like protein
MPFDNKFRPWFAIAIFAAVALCFVLFQNIKWDSKAFVVFSDIWTFAILGISVAGFFLLVPKRLKKEDELDSRIYAESARFTFYATMFGGFAISYGIISLSRHLHKPEWIPLAIGIILTVSATSLIELIVRFFVRRHYTEK